MKSLKEGLKNLPRYYFEIPAQDIIQIQGVTPVLVSSGAYSFLVSSSYGDNGSSIYRLDYVYKESNKFKYKFKGYEELYELPSGLEGLHATKSGVWTLFESGAQYFQKRKNRSWRTFLPYVIRIKKSSL